MAAFPDTPFKAADETDAEPAARRLMNRHVHLPAYSRQVCRITGPGKTAVYGAAANESEKKEPSLIL